MAEVLQPHQQRVVEEKQQLDEKREKLKTFIDREIFQSLEKDYQTLLIQQLESMDSYSEILGKRIDRF